MLELNGHQIKNAKDFYEYFSLYDALSQAVEVLSFAKKNLSYMYPKDLNSYCCYVLQRSLEEHIEIKKPTAESFWRLKCVSFPHDMNMLDYCFACFWGIGTEKFPFNDYVRAVAMIILARVGDINICMDEYILRSNPASKENTDKIVEPPICEKSVKKNEQTRTGDKPALLSLIHRKDNKNISFDTLPQYTGSKDNLIMNLVYRNGTDGNYIFEYNHDYQLNDDDIIYTVALYAKENNTSVVFLSTPGEDIKKDLSQGETLYINVVRGIVVSISENNICGYGSGRYLIRKKDGIYIKDADGSFKKTGIPFDASSFVEVYEEAFVYIQNGKIKSINTSAVNLFWNYAYERFVELAVDTEYNLYVLSNHGEVVSEINIKQCRVSSIKHYMERYNYVVKFN